MATVVVPLKGAADLMRRLGEQARVGIERGLESAALRAKTIVEQSTVTAPPASRGGSRGAFNTGEYRRRWKASVVAYGNRRGVLVSNDAPYAGVIEYGRRPGARRPPVEPIARWAQRKLGLPYEMARGIAFGIARNIGRRGLLPRRVLTGKTTQDKLVAALQAEVLHELRRLGEGLR